MLYTTYKLALDNHACNRALEQWVDHVGGIKKLNKLAKIPLTDILDVLRLDDTLWVMRNACKGDTKTISVKFAIACADRVLIHFETQYPNDKRPRLAIEAAQNYLLHPDKITMEAVRAAAGAACAAAEEAGEAAWAAGEAAWAAGEAAWAAWAAACAARAAARAAGEAAWAACAAAEEAGEAACAARAAARAAGEAECKWQTVKLKELLQEDK